MMALEMPELELADEHFLGSLYTVRPAWAWPPGFPTHLCFGHAVLHAPSTRELVPAAADLCERRPDTRAPPGYHPAYSLREQQVPAAGRTQQGLGGGGLGAFQADGAAPGGIGRSTRGVRHLVEGCVYEGQVGAQGGGHARGAPRGSLTLFVGKDFNII